MKTQTRQKSTYSETITNAFVCCLITILPLSTLFQDYSVIARGKFIILCVLTSAYVLFSAYGLVKKENKITIKSLRVSDLALITYLLFSALSAMLSEYFADAILGASRYEGLVTVFIYVFIFFAVKYYGVPKQWMIYAIGGTSVVFSLIAMLQINGKNPLNLFPSGLNYYDAGEAYEGAYISTIGNADVAGAFVCLVIPCILFYVVLQKKDYWRFFLLFPLVLLIIVWQKMDVTAARLGLIFGIIITIPFLQKKKSSRILGIAVLLTFALIGIIGLYWCDFEFGLFHEIHAILHGRIADGFGSSRIWIWTEVWPIAKEHLLFGIGPDTLIFHRINHTVYNPSINANIVASIDVAHNELYNILVQQGLLALAAYMSFLITIAWKWAKNAHANLVLAICGAPVICYFIQAMFSMSACTTTPVFMICLAMIDSQSMKNRVLSIAKQ